MRCQHPPEELQRVYEGTATPRTDRLLCSLCGELLYLTPGQPQAPASERERDSGVASPRVTNR
jgi:hypothetical protein